MHIASSSQSPENNKAKCTKMTEEGTRKHALNGSSDCVNSSKKDSPTNATPCTSGGRLKFFKDGKFILELAQAREGDKVNWVSVPKKTFWPPKSNSNAVAYKQESSTSLSVSDDNSSIQSSPWQRDHSWKQQTPRKNSSAELSFLFSKRLTLSERCAMCVGQRRRRRRRPFDSSSVTSCECRHRDSSTVDNGDKISAGTESNDKESLAPSNACNSHNNNRKPAPSRPKRTLGAIVEGLRERQGHQQQQQQHQNQHHPPAQQQQQTAAVAAVGRTVTLEMAAPTTVATIACGNNASPRKRILRELERVTIEDGEQQRQGKRHRGKRSVTPDATPAPPSSRQHPVIVAPSQQGTGSSSVGLVNGAPEPVESVTKTSSYSITSLLGRSDNRQSKPTAAHAHAHLFPHDKVDGSGLLFPAFVPAPFALYPHPSAGYPHHLPAVYGLARAYYDHFPPPLLRPPADSLYGGHSRPDAWPQQPAAQDQDPVSDVPLNLSKHS